MPKLKGFHLALGLLAATGLVLNAEQPAPKTSQPEKKQTGQKSTKPAAKTGSSSQGMKVFIDPATGEMRAPTPAELQALEAAAPETRTGVATRAAGAQDRESGSTITLPNGAVVTSAPVPEELHSHSVVRIGPDGKLQFDCVQGPDAANSIVKSAAKTTVKKGAHNHAH